MAESGTATALSTTHLSSCPSIATSTLHSSPPPLHPPCPAYWIQAWTRQPKYLPRRRASRFRPRLLDGCGCCYGRTVARIWVRLEWSRRSLDRRWREAHRSGSQGRPNRRDCEACSVSCGCSHSLIICGILMLLLLLFRSIGWNRSLLCKQGKYLWNYLKIKYKWLEYVVNVIDWENVEKKKLFSKYKNWVKVNLSILFTQPSKHTEISSYQLNSKVFSNNPVLFFSRSTCQMELVIVWVQIRSGFFSLFFFVAESNMITGNTQWRY